MREWTTHRLEDLVHIKHGFAFKGEYFSDKGPGPVLVTPGNFAIGGGFKIGKEKYYKGPEIAGFDLSPGDLVVTMTDLSKAGDTLGYSAIIPAGNRYLHNQRIGLVEIIRDDLLDKSYLHYALRTDRYRSHVLSGATGSTVRHTSPSRIASYEISLPPLSEQRAMAEVLGALDDKIAVNDGIAARCRELGLAYFREAVDTGPAVEVTLTEVTSFLGRGVAPKYSESLSELTVLNQKCVRNGRIGLSPARRTLSDKVPAQKHLKVHDVLVNSTGVGTLGRVARWTAEMEATVDSHVTIVRFDPEKVDPVCAGFAMLLAEPEIETLGEGSTGQTELSRVKLGTFSLRLPSTRQAQSLRPLLDSLESKADVALAESAALAKLRDTLLPKIMSGDIRVRDVEKLVEEAT
ncbi:restriction endonuclease subunit S [Microbispora sp. GKU 823]|uniref:restriction endonuclease subunit S n=1 Tax=Microbispora sp. GKU 823 TaxID=1652100 RepID=UPI0009A34153|nr:restriction endonuclease subunit S [Microbispora sp. GKU 823]OPG14161.1 hypothetical protein B1L11_03775 [Microbispora sp. GKU 823]